MYRIVSSEFIVKENIDNNSISFIPTDPANVDYQEYLRWQQVQQQSEVSTGVIEEPAVAVIEPATAPAVEQSQSVAQPEEQSSQPEPEPEEQSATQPEPVVEVQPVAEPESP